MEGKCNTVFIFSYNLWVLHEPLLPSYFLINLILIKPHFTYK